MSVFVVVGAVAVLMLVYMISVLGALPWFIYIPFVLLFALVFFWDKIRARLGRFDIKRARFIPSRKKDAKGKRSGKRI